MYKKIVAAVGGPSVVAGALWVAGMMAGMMIVPATVYAQAQAINEVIEEIVVTGTRRQDRTDALVSSFDPT